MKPHSFEVTDGMERAGARAMLRAVGMTDDDWGKAQVGVASSWNEVTPCNMPLDRLAKRAKEGVRAAGGFPMEFVTIAVSDGISMGHEGMRGSLVSREIITDSVECMVHSERFDALVTFAGCDKSLPGMLMAAARTNVPSVFLYGGSILPGHYKGQALDVVSVFEAVGACAAGTITENELGEIERRACPTEGSCAGMFTANTMAAIAEAIGMALPGSSAAPAVDRRRDDFAYQSGEAVVNLVALGIRPRQIMTKEAFENAIAITMALGGSTNAVLHLLAIAHEAGVELELDDFNRVGARVPHIADMKPHGKYHMVDLDRVGGVEVVLRELLEHGLLHGDCLTVTGKTMAENLADLDPPKPDGEVVHPLTAPIHTQGGIAVLRGSLAPNGGVVKVAGIDDLRFDGIARVFDGEEFAMEAILAGQDQPRRHRRDPLRRPEGRARDARDARGHRRDEGRRAGRRRRARHRRAVLRGHARFLCRARRTRSRRRRADRARRRGRSHRDRRRRAHHRPPRRRRRARTPAQHLEADGAALHDRVPREVRQAGAGSRARRDHELLSSSEPVARDPRSRVRSPAHRGARAAPHDREGARARRVVPEAGAHAARGALRLCAAGSSRPRAGAAS